MNARRPELVACDTAQPRAPSKDNLINPYDAHGPARGRATHVALPPCAFPVSRRTPRRTRTVSRMAGAATSGARRPERLPWQRGRGGRAGKPGGCRRPGSRRSPGAVQPRPQLREASRQCRRHVAGNRRPNLGDGKRGRAAGRRLGLLAACGPGRGRRRGAVPAAAGDSCHYCYRIRADLVRPP